MIQYRPSFGTAFAEGQGVAYVDRQRVMGGQIRRVAGPIGANADITLSHDLRAAPRSVICLDAGASFVPQVKRSGTGYDAKQVKFQLSTAIAGGDYGVFFIS